jgi:hypothetical protein
VDGDFDIARERAEAIARYDGIRLVEDSLDIETCEGAATIGLELVDTAPLTASLEGVPSRLSWTTPSWWLTTPSWSGRGRSSRVCGCSSSALAWSSNRPPRSASRRFSKTATASPADTSSLSCAAATSI